jgi:long-chain fatty acid transport protein
MELVNANWRLLLGTCALAVTYSVSSHAGGIYLYEMSNVSEAGYAGAGMVARANDAGTVFTNPAGMTRFDAPELIAGGTLVYIYGSYRAKEETTVDGTTRTVKNLIPAGSMAYVHPVSDRLKVGISLQNHFGLALDWKDDWVGRYNAVRVALVAPQLQPTASYRVNDWLSVGAGAALTLGYLNDKARVEPILPGRPDGKLRISDTDFAVQYNLGIMLEPTDSTRIGLRYLSETDLNFKDAPDVSGLLLRPDYAKIDLGLKMPQSVMAGIHHQINDDWAVLGSVGWDEWSEFARVRVGLDGLVPDVRVDADFQDVWHFGVGAEHQYNPKWMLTAGVGYDTPLASDRTGPIELPMSNLYRYAAGFKYKARDDLILGAGLTWLYEGSVPHAPANGVYGKYKNVSITFLSFYARWH